MQWSHRARLRIHLLDSLKDGPIRQDWFADSVWKRRLAR